MKKLLRLFILSALISGLSFAGVLNVTSPAANSQWCINDSNNKLEIRWHETPHDHQLVKIRLFDSGANTKIMDIANDAINDGAYNWLIPATVQPGQYTVLVKTTDNQEFDFSAPITIKSCSETEPFVPVGTLEGKVHFIPKPDLEIKIIPIPGSVDIYQKALVEFRVKNIGAGSSKATKLKAFIGTTNTNTWDVGPLDPGRFMYKTKEITPGGVGYIMWSAVVDKDNLIGDNNRQNNFAKYKMPVKGPDLIVCLSNGKRPAVGSRVDIHADVKNIGVVKSKSCELRLYVKQKGVTKHTIPALDPGKSFRVTRKHGWALAGTKKITAFIDWNFKLPESNEKNNKIETSYFVRLPHHDKYAVSTGRFFCSDGTKIQ